MSEAVQSTEPEVSGEDQSVCSTFGAISDEPSAEPATDTPEARTPEQELMLDDIDWNTVNYLKLDINKLPKEYQPLARQAKKMQASFTRAQQPVRDKEKFLDSQIAQLQQLQRMAPQTQQSQTPGPQSEVQQLQTFLGNYGLTPETAGYQEYALVAKMTHDAQAPLMQQIGQLTQIVQQLYQANQQVTGHIQQTQVQPYNAQFEAAVSAGHDPDEIRQYAQALIPLVDQIENPATPGKMHTIQSAYELVSGKAAQRSAEMQSQSRNARTNARNRTSIPPNGASSASNGAMTDAELQAELKKLGFS